MELMIKDRLNLSGVEGNRLFKFVRGHQIRIDDHTHMVTKDGELYFDASDYSNDDRVSIRRIAHKHNAGDQQSNWGLNDAAKSKGRKIAAETENEIEKIKTKHEEEEGNKKKS